MLNAITGNFLDKGVQTLAKRLSELAWKSVGAVIKKPQYARLKSAKCLAEMGYDADKTFLGDLDNGDAVGYMSGLGNSQNAPMAE